MSGPPQDVSTDLAKVGPAATTFTGLNREALISIAEKLEADYQIGLSRDRSKAYPQVVHLRTNEIFARLVNLYANLFTTHWSLFQSATNLLYTSTTSQKQLKLARVYISSWFRDLYVSNSDATRNISGEIYDKYYSHQIAYVTGRYDPFLQHLNTIIRPTHVHMIPCDIMYYPVICEKPNWSSETNNPFNIPLGAIDFDVIRSLMDIFSDESNNFAVLPLNTNILGRPGWLFDFHQNQAFSWFPMENNFSSVDLIAPHILGLPCTPRLGPADIDHWANFTNNKKFTITDPARYSRRTSRTFYGSAEYRTVEYRSQEYNFEQILATPEVAKKTPVLTSPPPSRATGKEKASGSLPVNEKQPTAPADDQPMPDKFPPTVKINQYRFIDWCYHIRVILNSDAQTINKAFRTFIFKGATPE